MEFRAILLLILVLACTSGSPITQSPENEDSSTIQGSSNGPLSYTYKGKEDGEEVEEQVTIDKDKKTETEHIPRHDDKEELDVIKDFNLNLTMYRLPGQKICLLAPFEKDEASLDELAEKLKKLQNGESQPSESNSIATKWHGDQMVDDRSFLSDEMASLCAKYPIYMMEKGLGSSSSRKKRSYYYRCCRWSCVWFRSYFTGRYYYVCYRWCYSCYG